MSYSKLKSRLERLETLAKRKKGPAHNTVFVGVYEGNDDDIVGAGICGRRVPRNEGETIERLAERAGRELGMRVLFAVYSNGQEAS